MLHKTLFRHLLAIFTEIGYQAFDQQRLHCAGDVAVEEFYAFPGLAVEGHVSVTYHPPVGASGVYVVQILEYDVPEGVRGLGQAEIVLPAWDWDVTVEILRPFGYILSGESPQVFCGILLIINADLFVVAIALESGEDPVAFVRVDECQLGIHHADEFPADIFGSRVLPGGELRLHGER